MARITIAAAARWRDIAGWRRAARWRRHQNQAAAAALSLSAQAERGAQMTGGGMAAKKTSRRSVSGRRS